MLSLVTRLTLQVIINSYPSSTSSGMLRYASKDNLGGLRWGLAVPLPGRALFGLRDYNQVSTQHGLTSG